MPRKDYHPKVPRQCAVCGRAFMARVSPPSQCCSRSCAAKLHGPVGMAVRKNLAEMTFGKLRVIYPTNENDGRGHAIWMCECACGTRKKYSSWQLKVVKVRSCGHCRASLAIPRDDGRDTPSWP